MCVRLQAAPTLRLRCHQGAQPSRLQEAVGWECWGPRLGLLGADWPLPGEHGRAFSSQP